MLSTLRNLFDFSATRQQAQAAYNALVAKSREPFFYAQYRVPDTLDGRFDVIVLHLFLVLERMNADPSARKLSQYLMEAFFADMDRSLREIGVGDMGVGKRVKKMASAFYGRVQAYREALENEGAFISALSRNVYRQEEGVAEGAKELAAYLYAMKAVVERRPAAEAPFAFSALSQAA